MTEQYIYSRSEREFVNSLNQTVPLGFGFMEVSPGMDKGLKQDVAVHCEDCPRLSLTDSQGGPLPLFRKTLLPKGQVLFQKSTWIEEGRRDFHVAHGYVLDAEEVKSAGPAKWLNAVFQLGDPNAVPDGILPLKSRLEFSGCEFPRFYHLRDIPLGLDREQFCQMLLACFDALASRQQVLIAWDFEQPGEEALRQSVLYWIYICLPFDLWVRLGFDSVYTDKSSPGLVQLAFVDKTSVQDGDRVPSIQLGNQMVSLGGNYLVWDGEIIHNDGKYKTEWYHKDVAYGKWLEQLVNIIWNCPKEKQVDMVKTLENIRCSPQCQMSAKAGEKRLNPENFFGDYESAYDLRILEEAAGLVEPVPPATKCTKGSEKCEPGPGHEPSPMEVIQRIARSCTQLPELEDIQDLAGIRGELEPAAVAFLSAFVAREADMPEAKVSAVLYYYQKLLRPNVYAQLPCRVFWGELGDWDLTIWSRCGASRGVEAAKARRLKWYKEIVLLHNKAADLTAYYKDFLDGLPGLSSKQRISMETEYFPKLLESIWSRRTRPGSSRDIQFLASILDRRVGPVALGFLGAFMVQEADAPQMPLCKVLNFYRGYLPPDVYSQLLRQLFWDELTNTERSVWKKYGVKSSVDAAKQRRFKWYQEIAEVYNPPEDAASFARRWLNMLPGIKGQNRMDMEEELQMIVKWRLEGLKTKE